MSDYIIYQVSDFNSMRVLHSLSTHTECASTLLPGNIN